MPLCIASNTVRGSELRGNSSALITTLFCSWLGPLLHSSRVAAARRTSTRSVECIGSVGQARLVRRTLPIFSRFRQMNCREDVAARTTPLETVARPLTRARTFPIGYEPVQNEACIVSTAVIEVTGLTTVVVATVFVFDSLQAASRALLDVAPTGRREAGRSPDRRRWWTRNLPTWSIAGA